MTLQQLQYLMEVYRTGSISGAAKKLFLAQSSLSASISSLESELGFPVFIRTKNGMTPTVQGAHVIEHAARICESYHTMLETSGLEKRHIRISAPAYAPIDSAFVRLAEAYRDNSTVTFSVDSFTTADAVMKLSALELDIVILMNHEARFLPVKTLLESKGLQWKTLASLPVFVRIGPGHRLYNSPEIPPEELENDLLADDVQDPLVHNHFLNGFLRLSPERTVSVKSSYARNLLVARGVAYSIGAGLPPAHNPYGLRCVPLAGVSYAVTVVTNPLNAPEKEADLFCALIKNELSGLE